MNKRIRALLLAVTVLFSTALLCACGESETAETATDAAYTVTVLDADGKPAADIVVKFMQNGTQVAMQPVNAEGIAQKTLKKGEYTLELLKTDNSVPGYYDPSAATLTADKTTTQITLYKLVDGESMDLTVGEKTYKTYNVTVGSTYVEVKKGERNYFLFTPNQAGSYKVSVDNKDMKLGTYGNTFYVQQNSTEEVVDNAFSISVYQSMIGTDGTGTAVYVLGIDGTDTDGHCVLTIQRTGDPVWSVEDEPWTVYQPTHTPAPFTLEQNGKKLTYVDIKGTAADNQVVYNEADGYYHFGTADGPVVYINLGKDSPNVSLQVMIQGDGPMGGAPLRKYFWSSEEHTKESFIKREDYTDIMVSYFDNMDKSFGVYPLTKDLVYIVQNACADWWTATSPSFILEGCNPEIGWMFALCYLA